MSWIKNKWILFFFFFLLFQQVNADSISTLTRSTDPSSGSQKSGVILVEFYDYQCGHCISMSEVIDRLSARNPSLRIVYKPIAFSGPNSSLAAKAALAAFHQGKFLVMHHALINHASSLSKKTIFLLAKENGLQMEKFTRDLEDKTKLNENYQLAKSLKIPGTPAFFIGRTDAGSFTQLNGEISEGELQKQIDALKN